jgi:hypothetical protein
MKTEITQHMLRELLAYSEETGEFVWKSNRSGHACKGKVAGCIDRNTGYVVIGFRRKFYKGHRLAWLYVYGDWPAFAVDHINGNKSDNRISNLREAPGAINQQNQRAANKRNKTGVLGVTLQPSGSFRAQIRANGRAVSLGSFKTIEAATAAYVEAKRGLHPGCTI